MGGQNGSTPDHPRHLRDPRFESGVDDHSGFRTRSILCVPMIYRGQLTGVLEVLNKRGGRQFNEDDQEILTVLANQIATAIENARLYERLSERYTQASFELRSTRRSWFGPRDWLPWGGSPREWLMKLETRSWSLAGLPGGSRESSPAPSQP